MSTPQKTHSSQPQGSSSVLQEELKRHMGDELSNQVWQLPPARIAEMLCPFGLSPPPIEDAVKSLKSKLTSAAKSDVSRVSLVAGGEKRNYPPLRFIMNACIDSCVEVIEQRITTPRWFTGLQFIDWDLEMSDGVDGAKPLKPDLVGVNNPPAHPMVYWSLAEEYGRKRRLLLPIEVRGNDAQMVMQAATYARALNRAVPFREFELVLTYNHNSDQFRFLIFHRGGLTSSGPIKLRYTTEKIDPQPPDYTDLVRMFMSILSWTKANDAGYPVFSNGKQFILPDPLHPTLAVNLILDEVLYQKPGVRSRNTWVARLTTQDASAPHAATAVDSDEGQQSEEDEAPEPSNTPRKSVRLKFLAAKEVRGAGSGVSSGVGSGAGAPRAREMKLKEASMLDMRSFMRYVLIAVQSSHVWPTM